MTTIYVDNAATTKTSRTAIEAMLPYMDKIYGNPSSLHSVGQAAADALRTAREEAAEVLGCEPSEITFTSGGSEADNQALVSAAAIGARKGKKHIISTAFEHHAVLHTLKKLEKEGFEVTLLDVHKNGMVSARQVADAIREDTCLVTVMYANNEIGSIQPIAEIGAVCREKGVIFHTDAVQAVAKLVDSPAHFIQASVSLLDSIGQLRISFPHLPYISCICVGRTCLNIGDFLAVGINTVTGDVGLVPYIVFFCRNGLGRHSPGIAFDGHILHKKEDMTR